MKLRLAAQLGAGFAVPIIALALVLAAVSLVFAHIHDLQADSGAKREIARTVHDAQLRLVQERYATIRNALRSPHALEQFRAAQAAENVDLDELRNASGAVPGTGPLVEDVTQHSALVTARLRTSEGIIARQHKLPPDSPAYLALERQRTKNRGANDVDGKIMDADINQLIALTNVAVQQSQDEFSTQLRRVNVALLALGALTLLATIAITLLLTRRITSRLRRVAHALESVVREDFAALSLAMQRLAEGDLRGGFRSAREPVGDHGGDEIADVVRSTTS